MSLIMNEPGRQGKLLKGQCQEGNPACARDAGEL